MATQEVPDLVRTADQLDDILGGHGPLETADLTDGSNRDFRAALYLNWGDGIDLGAGIECRAVGLARAINVPPQTETTILEEHRFGPDEMVHKTHPGGACRRFLWTQAGGLRGTSKLESGSDPEKLAAYLIRLLVDTCLSNPGPYDPFYLARPGVKDLGNGTLPRLRLRNRLFVHPWLKQAVQEALRRRWPESAAPPNNPTR